MSYAQIILITGISVKIGAPKNIKLEMIAVMLIKRDSLFRLIARAANIKV
jgi:hypothetical protein